jgi:hypothetical protein
MPSFGDRSAKTFTAALVEKGRQGDPVRRVQSLA